jgi:hypothetical protein
MSRGFLSQQSLKHSLIMNCMYLMVCLSAQATDSSGVTGQPCTLVTAPVELPGVPQYTGRAMFIGGYDYPLMTHGRSICLNYAVQEDAATVLSWYRDAMKQSNWNVAPGQPDSKDVYCTMGNNFCDIKIGNASRPGYRASISIVYKFGN